MSRFHLAPQPPLPFPAADDYARAALAASTGPWPGIIEHREHRFGPAPWQVMDIFAPQDLPAGGCDVLVFFHGGGWTNGYKEWVGFMAPALAAQNVMLVAPTHRLAPVVRYPDFLHDALAAIAAARRLVPALGGNPDRLFLSGHSAGGHVAAMCALRPDLRDIHGIPAQAICGCLPVSGILDLHHPAPPPGSLEARVYDTVLTRPEDDREASPLSWLRKDSVPLFLTWGERDSERVRRSNAEAERILTGLGVTARYRIYPEDHFGTHLALRDPAHDWYAGLCAMRQAI